MTAAEEAMDLMGHQISTLKRVNTVPVTMGGLLDISTARYFYKVPKTILHKPTANSGINIFYKKCLYKHYLQLLLLILFC